jgi:hypothetical protein
MNAMRECVDEGILQSYFDGELSRKAAEGVASHLASCIGCAQAASELESESLLLAEALGAEFALSVPTERLRHRVEAAIVGLQVNSARASVVSNAGGTPAVPVVRGWVQSIAELFTLSPQRAFGYAGLVAVILFATVVGGIYWRYAGTTTVDVPGPVAETRGPAAVPIVPVEKPSDPTPTPTTAKNVVRPVSLIASPKKAAPRPPRPTEVAVRLLPGERSYLKTIASLDANIKAESNRQMKPSLQVEYERNLAMVDQAIAATRSAAKVNPNDPDAADFMFAAYQSKIDLLNQVADSRLSNRQH